MSPVEVMLCIAKVYFKIQPGLNLADGPLA